MQTVKIQLRRRQVIIESSMENSVKIKYAPDTSKTRNERIQMTRLEKSNGQIGVKMKTQNKMEIQLTDFGKL